MWNCIDEQKSVVNLKIHLLQQICETEPKDSYGAWIKIAMENEQEV